MSELNRFRRETLNLFEIALCESRSGYAKKGKPEVVLPNSLQSVKKDDTARLEIFFYSLDAYNNFDKAEVETKCRDSNIELNYLVPAVELIIKNADDDKMVPYISNISKGMENRILLENEEKLWKLMRERGVYIGNLGTLALIKSLERKYRDIGGVRFYADYGFNAYNDETIRILHELGAKRVIASLETDDAHYGAIPLMVSEHGWEEEKFVDRKSKEYRIVKRDTSDQDIISATDFVDISLCIRKAKQDSRTVRIYVN